MASKYCFDKKITEGFENIKKYISEKNKKMFTNVPNKNNMDDEFFLILQSKLRFLDGLDEEIKEKVELIDMPGLNETNAIFLDKLMPTIIKRSSSFIYLMKPDSIDTNDDKIILECIKNVIEKNEKMNLIDLQQFIPVLNKIDQISNNDKDGEIGLLNKAKEHIKKSLKINISHDVIPYSAKKELEKVNPSFKDYLNNLYSNYHNEIDNSYEDFNDYILNKIQNFSKTFEKKKIEIKNINENIDMNIIAQIKTENLFRDVNEESLKTLCKYMKYNKTYHQPATKNK